MKVAFLDRDGTIIKDYPDEQWAEISQPDFFPESIHVLKKITENGYEIIFISNQYLINDRIISQEQFEHVNQLFLAELKLNDIPVLDFFYCPHTDADNCCCKKPKTGMIEAALKKYPQIDLASSFYLGDSEVDVLLAEKMKLNMFHLTSEKKSTTGNCTNIHSLSDMLSYLSEKSR